MAARTLERKNNNKVVSFSELFFMFTLTWMTEKELERVRRIRRKKNMEIQRISMNILYLNTISNKAVRCLRGRVY